MNNQLDIEWFVPSRKYNPDEYGELMITNQTIFSQFEMNKKTAVNIFSIKEHTVESEES